MCDATVDTGAPEIFRHVYSCDLEANFIIKVGTLEGKPQKPHFQDIINDPILQYSGNSGCSDYVVSCQVFASGKPLTLPIQTSYKTFTNRWHWNEWLTLPIKFCDLPRNAVLAFTVWSVYGPRKTIPIGGTTISVFGKYGALRKGIHDLRLWPGREADGTDAQSTPAFSSHEKIGRLVKLSKKYHSSSNMACRIDWLDPLTFSEIEALSNQERMTNPNALFLMIEFPRIVYDGVTHTVVYWEKDTEDTCLGSWDGSGTSGSVGPVISDPDIGFTENLVEAKHHLLSRNTRTELIDKDIKPDATTRNRLQMIVSYPPTKQLSADEQDLVWKFRFYLRSQKRALVKFVKCVNWQVSSEAQLASEMINSWLQPMDVEDALELLGPNFQHPTVRQYAVMRLQQAEDDDLLLYLLQLVQALKYEDVDKIIGEAHQTSTVHSSESSKDDCSGRPMDLATFLISRASQSNILANFFYWYVYVETEDEQQRAASSARSGNGAGRDVRTRDMYVSVMRRFSNALQPPPVLAPERGSINQAFTTSTSSSVEEWCALRERRVMLTRQHEMVNTLVGLMEQVKKESGNRQKKIEKLRVLLNDCEQLRFSEPLPLPLDPTVRVTSILAQETTLFKSALMPCRLTFLCDDGRHYVAIFKNGDDLRQDQLVLQIIQLMDKLLRLENLDLKLTPYRVLATSAQQGFVQFIEAPTVSSVLTSEGSLLRFFQKHCPSKNTPNGVDPQCMDNYVRSCAGYCVITYLLGVGDRHLDNLLLTTNGKLFHIDFGYILGRDPKPLPPPMKLSKEMVEVMGGPNSDLYQEFRKQCYTVFQHLRRHANVILNLFSLMVNASIPDIALEPDKTVKKVQDKFLLDVSDEVAVQHMKELIDMSANAVMPVVVERFHKIAQYWRQ